eukprot:scaffold1878_cov258-Pinguiococcus_pyrenoidosus.AAC.13
MVDWRHLRRQAADVLRGEALCRIFDASFLKPGISIVNVISAIDNFWPSEVSLLVIALSEVGAIHIRRAWGARSKVFLPLQLGDSLCCTDEGMSKDAFCKELSSKGKLIERAASAADCCVASTAASVEAYRLA